MDLETLKEEIRSRADIVDIIGRVVKLQKAGPSHKGLCPFHHEKTPSFHVDPRKQSYYCFGCHAGGDVFNFIMDYEHVDFMGAMERLAQQTGVPFEFDRSAEAKKGPKKDRLFAIHEQVATWYEHILRETETGAPGREYLEKRQLRENSARDFRVGFAPDSFETLVNRLREAKFSDEEIEASGLVGIREEAPEGRERFYDRFRGRLMFPIRDELARVIGFSGRVLSAEQSKAKYVNSPETSLFKKSRVLYGIDLARPHISASRRAVLCEGQLDVIRCHEAGLNMAVAAQGTAVTEEHARILKRYADEVVLLLDSDVAGLKAALRSAESLLQAGLVVRVASLPEGEDPDSMVVHHGAEALKAVVEAAEPFVVFQIRSLLAAEEEINETSRMRVIRAVVETIAHAPEAVMREEMISKAAETLGVRPEALRQDVRPARPAAPRPAPPPRPLAPKPADPRPNLMPPGESMLLELLYLHPNLIESTRGLLTPNHLAHEESRGILEGMQAVESPTPEALQDHFREHPLGPRVRELGLRGRRPSSGDSPDAEQGVRELVLKLREDALKRRQSKLQEEHLHAKGERRADLETEIWQLTLVARKLRECRLAGQWDEAQPILDIYT